MIQVINQYTSRVEYTLRIKGRRFRPKVFDARAQYTVKVDDKILTDFSPGDGTIDIMLQQ